ncbi:hypothetical protein BHE97_08655 [Aeromicrobium sp. PE09-221]|uniref:alpha/beta hydrolase n=1 Tax=Aeromicrobium sp. PE09-221 TaxID=1898043 RepID=UPI000B3E6720|nr:alpha/beta hydrolase [Aeromicrobium sp. PE09-221]OUZ10116.1 hypothetical protein BHE97_08655 [Aeromicrobium sp. PE09-221]
MSSRREPLDPAIAALRDHVRASGAAPLSSLSPAEARERVSAGDGACDDGPAVRVIEDIDIGDAPALRIRRYDDGASRATLVYAHGGGWVTGDLEYADELCRQLASQASLQVLSVDYRLAPEYPFPAAVEDVDTALSWAVIHGGDQPVYVGGDSAGGNLAATIAQRRDEVAGLIAIYPVVDHDQTRMSYRENDQGFPIGSADMAWFFDHYAPRDVRDDPRVSPLRGIGADHPRTFLLTAGHDPLCDEGFAYAERLAALDVGVEHRHEPALCHGFLRSTGVSAGARAARDRLVVDIARFVDSGHLPTAAP